MLKRFDSKLVEARNCVAGFYSRKGGVSHGDYDSLNACIKSQDDPQNVAQNLQIIANDLNCQNENLKLVHQVHGNAVFTLDDAKLKTAEIQADAIVTKLTSIALGINTADCTPVLFCDITSGVVGAAHAGWRSAFSGILENTVSAMENLGANRRNIVAVIGPTIAQETYEVDSAFKEKFLSQKNDNQKYFIDSKKAQHYMFDLPGYCYDKLNTLKLKEVENTKLNTYTNEDLFFSCRRNFHKGKEEFGGQLSVIMLR